MKLELDAVKEDELLFYDIISFNNYGKALLAVYQAITLEGWVLMMYNYMDCNNPAIISVLFFVILVIGGAFFALNLVLAEIMETFYQRQAEEDAQAFKAANEAQILEDKKLEDERIEAWLNPSVDEDKSENKDPG